MIITCPNCHTRYQLAEHAIGSAGRKVSCAQCQESWLAIPEAEAPPPPPEPVEVPEEITQDPDKLFDADDEAKLDAEFEEVAGGEQDDPSDQANGDEEDDDTDAAPDAAPDAALGPPVETYAISDIKSSGSKSRKDKELSHTAGKLDAGLKGKRLRAMKRRQIALQKKLPMGRVRSGARLILMVILGLLIGGGLYFRTEIVRVVPDMAGVYAAIGVPVNVIGLEFENVETLRAMQNGVDVMLVSGRVRNVTGGELPVPAILVSILDNAGHSLYSWSVTPLSPFVGPHQKQDFEARLNAAPSDAVNVKLTFAEDRAE